MIDCSNIEQILLEGEIYMAKLEDLCGEVGSLTEKVDVLSDISKQSLVVSQANQVQLGKINEHLSNLNGQVAKNTGAIYGRDGLIVEIAEVKTEAKIVHNRHAPKPKPAESSVTFKWLVEKFGVPVLVGIIMLLIGLGADKIILP